MTSTAAPTLPRLLPPTPATPKRPTHLPLPLPPRPISGPVAGCRAPAAESLLPDKSPPRNGPAGLGVINAMAHRGGALVEVGTAVVEAVALGGGAVVGVGDRRPPPFVNGIGCEAGSCTISGLHFGTEVVVTLENGRHSIVADDCVVLSPNLIRCNGLAALGTDPIDLLVINPDSQSFFLRGALNSPPLQTPREDDGPGAAAGHYISFGPVPATLAAATVAFEASVVLYDRGLPLVGVGGDDQPRVRIEVCSTDPSDRLLYYSAERPVRNGVAQFRAIPKPPRGSYVLRAEYRAPTLKNRISTPPAIQSLPLESL